MIVFRFPPEARTEHTAFTVVGRDLPGGALMDEVMLVPDEALPERGFSGCIFYLDERRLPRLPVCTRTLVPEALAAHFPENPVYIVSGPPDGTLPARLEAASAAFGPRLWLVIRPLSHFFTLPCPSDSGRFVPPEEAGSISRLDAPTQSRALCCAYCRAEYSGEQGLYLFDTEQSMEEKLRLADKAGIQNVLVLLPDVQ